MLCCASADETMGKHPVQVYHVSPVVTDSVCTVAGATGLTMQFRGTMSNAPVVLSMDPICSHTLMSASYARRMKLRVECGGSLASSGGQCMVCTSEGTCKVHLKLQEVIADLMCHVVELADAYKVILGETGSASILLLCLGT